MRADVYVGPHCDKTKVRVCFYSEPDGRILETRGAVYDDPKIAHLRAARARDALRILGIEQIKREAA